MEENAGSLEQAKHEAGGAGSASQMASPIAGSVSGQPAEPYSAQSSKT
jgi:glycerol-3-phosphate acyltransferase PlsX